jgi:undecaprenyl diphosphate synthase
LDAIRRILEKSKEEPDLDITPGLLKKHLLTCDLPPVDLLIRTGGEPHLSDGFMMWDVADAQLVFSDKFWPEYTPEDFQKAIEDYSKRGRRFGK